MQTHPPALPTRVTTITGPAATHKTEMLIGVANREHAAGHQVVFISPEMRPEALWKRGLSPGVLILDAAPDGRPGERVLSSFRSGGPPHAMWEVVRTSGTDSAASTEDLIRRLKEENRALYARLPTCPVLTSKNGGPVRPCAQKIGHDGGCTTAEELALRR